MMSSKSKNIPQSRIVNTNSSGIVTIVIDDDSNEPKVADSVTTNRPALAVRPPVSVQSPKFVLTDESVRHNIVIQENKNNVILVNTSIKRPFSTTLINGTPFTSTALRIPKVNSETLPTTVKSQHNHVSKDQTHYVLVNKSNKQSSNTTICASTHSSPKQSSSPTKYRLWNQSNQPNNQVSRPQPNRTIVRVKERILPPEDTESDCMDDQTFFKYLNLIDSNEFKSKPQNELKFNWPLRKVAKTTKPELNNNGNLLLPNLKLLRTTITNTPNVRPDMTQRKHKWFTEAQNYNERLQKFKANLPSNPVIKERMQSELEALHKRLMDEKRRQNDEEDRYYKNRNMEDRRQLQKEEQKQEYENFINSFEFTSVMGRRVRDSGPDNRLSFKDIYLKTCKIEDYCAHKDICSVNAPQNTKLSTRITRSNTGFAGIDRMWGPRSESHEYCFNRRQRLEKYLRLETGLNWKSRLIRMQCKLVDIEVSKITRCPCCLELVEPEWGHSCRDSDCDSNNIEVMSINESDIGIVSENNSIDEDLASNNSEIITAGNIFCDECGFEDCNGNCSQDRTDSVTKISINDNPILIFSSDGNRVPMKKIRVEDKMMVQKVQSHDKNDFCNYQICFDQNRQFINQITGRNVDTEEDEESDDDIVIVKEVASERQTQSQQKSFAEPVIVMCHNTNEMPKQPIKRKFSDAKHRNSTDIIVIKKL